MLQLSRLEDLLSSSLLLVRTTHNANRPVNRLPMEVLACIFRCLLRDELTLGYGAFPSPVPTHSPKKDTLRDLTSLQQVCSYWRQTFRVFSSLWSVIVVSESDDQDDSDDPDDSDDSDDSSEMGEDEHFPPPRARLVRHFLSMSDPHPLDIHTTTLRGLGLIADHTSRLRHLQLSYPPALFSASQVQRALSLFCRAAPQLECLDLGVLLPKPKFTNSYRNNIRLRSTSQARLPPCLFAGDMPRLRRLRLCGVVDWSGNHFRALTHICITGCSGSVPPRSLDITKRLLNLLRDSQATVQELYLSHLDVWFARNMIEQLPDIANPVIHPTVLRRLSISDCFIWQLHILFFLFVVPSGTSLSVTNLLELPQHDPTVTGFFELYSRYPLRFKNLVDIQSLELNSFVRQAIAIGPSGSMRITVATSDGIHFSRIDRPINLSLFRALEELRICGMERPVDHSVADWAVGLSSLTCLQKLCIRHRFTKNILRALTPDTTSPIDHLLLCKSLQSLWITAYMDYPDQLAYDELLRCAEARSRCGYPIRQIRIETELALRKVHGLGSTIDPQEGWSESMLATVRQYVDVVEYGVKCPPMDIPSELDEDEHYQYWPRWSSSARA